MLSDKHSDWLFSKSTIIQARVMWRASSSSLLIIPRSELFSDVEAFVVDVHETLRVHSSQGRDSRRWQKECFISLRHTKEALGASIFKRVASCSLNNTVAFDEVRGSQMSFLSGPSLTDKLCCQSINSFSNCRVFVLLFIPICFWNAVLANRLDVLRL